MFYQYCSISIVLSMLRYLTEERKFQILVYREHTNTALPNSYSAMPAKMILVLISYLPEERDFLPYKIVCLHFHLPSSSHTFRGINT